MAGAVPADVPVMVLYYLASGSWFSGWRPAR